MNYNLDNDSKEITKSNIKIANSVIEKIVVLASRDVKGVYTSFGSATNMVANKMLSVITDKNVKVKIFDKEVSVDITIVVKYGYNILKVSKQVQSRIKTMIENMTGFKCETINVIVAGVYIDNFK